MPTASPPRRLVSQPCGVHAGGPAVYSLVYVSAARPPVSRASLRALLVQCRRDNAADQITGLLLYRDGTYMQMLEGDHDRVEALYSAIKSDPRHQEIITVRTRRQDHRQFPGWTMGFGDVLSVGASGGRDPDAVFDVEVDVTLDKPVSATQTAAEAELVGELLDLFDTI